MMNEENESLVLAFQDFEKQAMDSDIEGKRSSVDRAYRSRKGRTVGKIRPLN